ncbi:MAG: hypothetical protein A2Z14_12750 [Chloroflexi bacterium RBG_16_48_8]|nr:MAG: hypothetical protein A2Z14_12750 [Chloroflexi bacterium RBG_16_48_8]
MSGRVNGGRARMLDLEAARKTRRRLKLSTMTPDEASILIDSVLFRYGMDPTHWTDLSGRRYMMIGSAEGFARVDSSSMIPSIVSMRPDFSLQCWI